MTSIILTTERLQMLLAHSSGATLRILVRNRPGVSVERKRDCPDRNFRWCLPLMIFRGRSRSTSKASLEVFRCLDVHQTSRSSGTNARTMLTTDDADSDTDSISDAVSIFSVSDISIPMLRDTFLWYSGKPDNSRTMTPTKR